MGLAFVKKNMAEFSPSIMELILITHQELSVSILKFKARSQICLIYLENYLENII